MRRSAGLIRVLGCAIAMASLTAAAQSVSQRGFVLRVLNGRNGRPVQSETVRLWYDEQQGTPLVLQTAEDGTVQVPPPAAESIRVILLPTESVDCRKPRKEDPPLAYSLKSIWSEGVQAENACGSPGLRRHKGELILFVRDRRWYDFGVNQ